MSDTYRTLFTHRARMVASVIGFSFCLAFAGAAIAQTKAAGSAPSTGGPAPGPACDNHPQSDWLINPSDPGPVDARAILKLIHRYNWALDDHDFGQLDGLFLTMYSMNCAMRRENKFSRGPTRTRWRYISTAFSTNLRRRIRRHGILKATYCSIPWTQTPSRGKRVWR